MIVTFLPEDLISDPIILAETTIPFNEIEVESCACSDITLKKKKNIILKYIICNFKWKKDKSPFLKKGKEILNLYLILSSSDGTLFKAWKSIFPSEVLGISSTIIILFGSLFLGNKSNKN